ncbi:MAG: ester cyclase [Anaerolineae bacterium]|jgi:predicted ester cyclase
MSKKLYQICGLTLLAVALLLAGCTSAGNKGAEEEMAVLKAQADQAASNKQVVQTFLGLFMSGKWDDFDQVIATDCVLHEPGGVDIVGLDAMKALWQVAYAPLKDMNAATVAETSEGEILTGLYAMEATYEGEYMGQQIAGVPVKFNQAETMRIVDGKIVEWWVGFDRLWMSEQLGFELKPK